MNELFHYILKGFPIVIQVFVGTLFSSLLFALLISIIFTTKWKIPQLLVFMYTWVFRSTPLLLQLFFIYYALPYGFGIKFNSPLIAALVAFNLNYTAYFIETIRSGLNGIPKGQYEAAYTLGYTRFQTVTRIIYPQALRNILPTLTSEALNLIKDTALVSTIALADIFQRTQEVSSRTASIEPYYMAAILYLLLCSVVLFIFKFLEKKYYLEVIS